jgi:membrane-associated phospholipid phosphatase
VLAALLTVAVSAVLPAFGPQRVYGIVSAWDPVLTALRAGSHAQVPYVGIVSFPSFHASMAVILVLSMRGYRYGFAAAVVVNSFMLLATVPIGYHYFADVVAGCAFGLLALYAARLTEPSSNLAGLPLQTGNSTDLQPVGQDVV